MPKTSWWSALFDESKKIQRNEEIRKELLNKNLALKVSKKIEEKVIGTLINSLKTLSSASVDTNIQNAMVIPSKEAVDNFSKLDNKEENLVSQEVNKFQFNIKDEGHQKLLCGSNVVSKVGNEIADLTKNISSNQIQAFFDAGFIEEILTKKIFLNKSYLKYKKYFDLKGIAKALLGCPVNAEIQLRRIGSDIRKILYDGDEAAGIDKITGRIAVLGPAYSEKSKNIANIQKNTPKVLKEIKDKFVKEFEKGEHAAREKFKTLLLTNKNNISKIFGDYNENAEVYMYLGVINKSNGQNEFKDLKRKIKYYLKLKPKIKIPYVTVASSSDSATKIKGDIKKSFESFQPFKLKNPKTKEENEKEENEKKNEEEGENGGKN